MPSSTPPVISFTVRRPTFTSRTSSSAPELDGPFKIPALPRHLANSLAGSRSLHSREDVDSDDDPGIGIVFPETVSRIDDSSHHTDSSDDDSLVPREQQRVHSKRKKVVDEETLVIPALPNPDWREAARKRRAVCSRIQPPHSRITPSFVPDSARATTGADGSVGGLGTRGVINSGPQLSGLHVHQRVEAENNEDIVEAIEVGQSATITINETEDQRALRAILAGEDNSAHVVESIPLPSFSEADALKQDVEELPDVATVADYERVPISAFGAAMLRGMGWTGGPVAPKSEKRSKNALSQPYLPHARPALLGIGAKEREPDDDGNGKKKSKGRDMRYVPIIREGNDRGEGGSSRSGTVSRRGSRSPSRRERDSDRREDRKRDDERRRREREYDERDRERKDQGDNDRDRDRERRDDSRDQRDSSYRGRRRDGDARRYDGHRDRTREHDRRDR